MEGSKIENKYFKKAKEKAVDLIQNNEKLNHVLKLSRDKLNEVSNTKFIDNIKVFIRMIKAYTKGVYREVSLKSMLALVAAIVYFVMPVDLIPDIIPVTGLVDDFAVVMWVYNQLEKEINAFREWETELSGEDV